MLERITDTDKVKEVGKALRVLRRSFGLSMGSVSREMGMHSVADYSDLERGKFSLRETEIMFRGAVFAIIRISEGITNETR